MKAYLQMILNSLLGRHNHKWEMTSSFMSTNGRYGHESYCCGCGKIKHVKRFWNRRPIVVIINKSETK
jgi:hypothetical protein